MVIFTKSLPLTFASAHLRYPADLIGDFWFDILRLFSPVNGDVFHMTGATLSNPVAALSAIAMLICYMRHLFWLVFVNVSKVDANKVKSLR